MKINFNVPPFLGKELEYIKDSVQVQKKIAGDGKYTKLCNKWMEDKFNRIKKLNKSTALVNDESIIDTLLDLGNYSIMAAIWYKNKETENNNVL